MKTNSQETLVTKDGNVKLVPSDNTSRNHFKHFVAIYILLILSFTLHLCVIFGRVDYSPVENEEIFKDRGRRSLNQQQQRRRNVIEDDSVPTANVEFIHPKLRDDMKNQDEDPENPWVWLTSYSRVPVCAYFLRKNFYPEVLRFLGFFDAAGNAA